MPRPASPHPSAAALRKRRYDARKRNPVEEGGELRVVPLTYSSDETEKLTALGYLGAWDEDNRDAVAEAFARYVVERLARDASELGL